MSPIKRTGPLECFLKSTKWKIWGELFKNKRLVHKKVQQPFDNWTLQITIWVKHLTMWTTYSNRNASNSDKKKIGQFDDCNDLPDNSDESNGSTKDPDLTTNLHTRVGRSCCRPHQNERNWNPHIKIYHFLYTQEKSINTHTLQFVFESQP